MGIDHQPKNKKKKTIEKRERKNIGTENTASMMSSTANLIRVLPDPGFFSKAVSPPLAPFLVDAGLSDSLPITERELSHHVSADGLV